MRKPFRKQIAAAAVLLRLLGDAAPVLAQGFRPAQTAEPGSVPRMIAFQGRLEDGGVAVSGSKLMSFRLYESPTGGTPIFQQLNQSVSLAGGVFSVGLDIGLGHLVGGATKYLEIEIDGIALSPRDPLRAVPYARVAESVEGTIDISSGGFVISNQGGTILYVSSATGRVGIGTSSPDPASKVHIVGGDLVVGSPASFAAATGAADVFVEGNLVVDGAVSFQGATFADLGVATNTTTGELFKAGDAFLTVLQSGRTGLNTQSPGATLDVQAATLPGVILNHAAQPQLELQRAGAAVLRAGHNGAVGSLGTVTNTPLRLQTNGADVLTVTETGRVGIGNTNPATALDVAGDVNVTGAITLGTDLAVTEGGTGAGTAAGARTNLGALAIDGSNVAAGFPVFAVQISSTAERARRFQDDPADCSAPGEFPKGVDERGAAQNCTDIASGAEPIIEEVIYDADNDLDAIGGPWSVTASGTNDIDFDSGTLFIDVDQSNVGIGAAPNVGDKLDVAGRVDATDYTESGGNTLSNDISGNAATATALAANPADCSAGQAPLGITAAGAAEGCFDVATQSELDTHAALTNPHSATSANTASRIVLRDGSGDFSAGTITATLSGNAASATQLAAAPSTCAATEDALGIAADGDAAGCTTDSMRSEANVEGAVYDNDNTLAGAWTVTSAASNINFDGNTFVVDAANNRVGIGDPTPSTTLEVAGEVTATAMTLGGNGGNVPHACNVQQTTLNNATVTESCAANEIAVGGGGVCGGATTLVSSLPSSSTQWQIVCSGADAGNTAYAVCCTE